ncbi:MAG: hypothetical protein RIS35_3511 [Pseudomonadota bacterium]
MITILYFASLREALGTARETLEVPAGVTTLAELRTWLRLRGGAWAEALAEGKAVRMALDQSMTGPETKLRDGGEVAFFTPVTGG